jgi:hypothetical protein
MKVLQRMFVTSFAPLAATVRAVMVALEGRGIKSFLSSPVRRRIGAEGVQRGSKFSSPTERAVTTSLEHVAIIR